MSHLNKVLPVLFFVGLFQIHAAWAGPLGQAGLSVQYRLQAPVKDRPQYERNNKLTVSHIGLMLGPEESREGQDCQWLHLTFSRVNGETYRVWMLLTDWPDETSNWKVFRYLWREPDWDDAVEYVHHRTGEPIVSEYLWKYGWPRKLSGEMLCVEKIFPQAILFQGYGFRRSEQNAHETWSLPSRRTVVSLDPDLMIGFVFPRKDKHGRPSAECPDQKYEMVSVDDAYMRDHSIAGYNATCVYPNWVNRSSYWITHDGDFTDWPASLYRSNFRGVVAWIDEPGYHNVVHYRRHPELAGKLTPADSATHIQELHRRAFHKQTERTSRHAMHQRVAKRFGLGNLRLIQTNYYTWEYIWPTAWYQMAIEDGTPGIIDEDDETTSLVCLFNMALGTQIPATIENACAIRTATLRGACRNFNKEWGVSVYFPTEFQKKLTALDYFYRRGASYFRTWNCPRTGSEVHVPYSYQRMMAQAIRASQKRNPDRDKQKLLHAARTAIVLPYGYSFYYTPLHRVEMLHLERLNPAGKTYREVLSAVAEQVEWCLREGVEFDIAMDDPLFSKKGYDELIYIREDASVEIIQPSKSTPREGNVTRKPVRPELGDSPSIDLTIKSSRSSVPCMVDLYAEPKAGSGVVAEDACGRKLVYFEVFTPDNRFVRIDPKGPKVDFIARIAGKYRVRASTADCFGRAAFVWKEIELKPSKDVMVLPGQWRFSRDREDFGVKERWYREDFDDSTWHRVSVDRSWETFVGVYDGYGWYRVRFRVPDKVKGKALTLLFEGVDEQAWIYLDGKQVGERTVQSTGRTPSQIWNAPFQLDIGGLASDKEHVLAIRVHDCGNAGGIYRPVRVVLTE